MKEVWGEQFGCLRCRMGETRVQVRGVRSDIACACGCEEHGTLVIEQGQIRLER